MAFEELFLDREERERLALYGDLRDAPNRQMNIATAAMARGESYRQLRRQMAKVAEDLHAIDPDAPPLLRRGDGNMTAPPPISRVRYRIFLFRRSLPGKLLVKTLMQPDLTLPMLLEETGFSRAAFSDGFPHYAGTCAKKRSPLISRLWHLPAQSREFAKFIANYCGS